LLARHIYLHCIYMFSHVSSHVSKWREMRRCWRLRVSGRRLRRSVPAQNRCAFPFCWTVVAVYSSSRHYDANLQGGLQ